MIRIGFLGVRSSEYMKTIGDILLASQAPTLHRALGFRVRCGIRSKCRRIACGQFSKI